MIIYRRLLHVGINESYLPLLTICMQLQTESSDQLYPGNPYESPLEYGILSSEFTLVSAFAFRHFI